MLTCEERTYYKLKEKILAGGFPVGEFLPQRSLANDVDATIVTLRSALRLLENDGLIENVPKWGVRIPAEDEASLRDRYFMREVLELGAVQRLFELHRQDESVKVTLLKMAKDCDEMKPENPDSYRNFAEKHAALHHRIVEYSGSKLLVKEIERLNFRSMMLTNSSRGWLQGNDYRFTTHHSDLIQDLFTLPEAQALEAMRKHIRYGLELELNVIHTGGAK
ncbi:MAG: GntR family transcriptional regulator [Lentisphaeria bacterium]|nr:GntR family transcriptional regulator [Lentisphaeria bacterium]